MAKLCKLKITNKKTKKEEIFERVEVKELIGMELWVVVHDKKGGKKDLAFSLLGNKIDYI